MSYPNRKYMIIPFADVTDEMIANSMEYSKDTLRNTVKGNDNVILKYEGSKPRCFYGIDTYSHSEILLELQKEEWTDEDA
jgi:hypothetical protein